MATEKITRHVISKSATRLKGVMQEMVVYRTKGKSATRHEMVGVSKQVGTMMFKERRK